MAGWHHQLDGHEFDKLQEMVKDREACCAAIHEITEPEQQQGLLYQNSVSQPVIKLRAQQIVKIWLQESK